MMIKIAVKCWLVRPKGGFFLPTRFQDEEITEVKWQKI